MSEEPPDIETYDTWEYPGGVTVEFQGTPEEAYRAAIDEGIARLSQFFGGQWPDALSNMKIVVDNGLIEGGALAVPEENKIILDKDKNSMSLSEAERYVMTQTDYEIEEGEMTSLSPYPDQPFSSATTNIVHESAHILDWKSPGNKYNRLETKYSPSVYGKRGPHEAFAVAFTDYVFGKEIPPEAQLAIKEIINQGGTDG